MKALCIAHRGRHVDFFENTENAFLAAARMDFYSLETDVHLTKDHKWVVNHDDYIFVNKKKMVIEECNYDEIVNLPFDNSMNDKKACIIPLERYLEICHKYHKHAVVEIKCHPDWIDTKNLLKIIKRTTGYSNTTVITFFTYILVDIKSHCFFKKIDLQQLCGRNLSQELLDAKKNHMDIDIDMTMLTKEIVDDVHNRKNKVNVWCCDTFEDLEKCNILNVDYITTNVFTQKDLKI